jgi:hypothetical protein
MAVLSSESSPILAVTWSRTGSRVPFDVDGILPIPRLSVDTSQLEVVSKRSTTGA